MNWKFAAVFGVLWIAFYGARFVSAVSAEGWTWRVALQGGGALLGFGYLAIARQERKKSLNKPD